MSSRSAFLGRLQSRWRKWIRDPAAFTDDLPAPWLRQAAVLGLAGGTVLSDLLDRVQASAAREWRRGRVALRLPPGEGTDFLFTNADGTPPKLWPDRVLIEPLGISAVVVAHADGGVMTAADLAPNRPGVIALGRSPSHVRIYRTDHGAGLPDRIEARALSRSAFVRMAREQGLGLAHALRRAWPPHERRPAEPDARTYGDWILRNEPAEADAEDIRRWFAGLSAPPRVSILMPVHDPRPRHLRTAIESVRNQICGDWRLCIADDGSRSAEVRSVLKDAARDPRIRLVRHEEAMGVAAATNAALSLADGEVALFLDHDDVLAPHALAAISGAFCARPDAAAVYSDEDVIDADGRRSAPVFKPDLDPERLLAQNFVNHAFAVRLDLLRRIGALREGVDGAQDHDLVLRILESGEGPILHLPQVLYHWRIYPAAGTLSQSSAASADRARARAVRAHLARTAQDADVRPGPRGHLIVEPCLAEPPPDVLAIVPTRDRPGLLEACVAGLLGQTDYPSIEVCIVDNGSTSSEALALLEKLATTPKVRVMRIDAPFNFAALNNAAAKGASAHLLAFVNDDILVAEPGWLKVMAALAVRPDVGAVGAKLFYPDGRLQHAGIVLGLGPQKVAGHEFRGAPGDSPGPQNRLLLTRRASAVTAACMLVERSKFEEVGGFDAEAFPVAFNDVDLCLRLAQRGHNTIWTPHARLMHLESATRGSDRATGAASRFAEEARRMHERWAPMLEADPCYNPNLTIRDESFTLADRSRARLFWR
jgi:GT2 family glycosyltransferase